MLRKGLVLERNINDGGISHLILVFGFGYTVELSLERIFH